MEKDLCERLGKIDMGILARAAEALYLSYESPNDEFDNFEEDMKLFEASTEILNIAAEAIIAGSGDDGTLAFVYEKMSNVYKKRSGYYEALSKEYKAKS